MATPKSPAAVTSTQSGRNKDDLPTLKNKVAELERQVTEYKTKLDELRRAKATTVVKLEKEYVNTTVPGLNRPEKTKACEKCEEYEKLIESERKSNAQLKRLIEQKENSKQQTTTTTTNSGPCAKCSDLNKLLTVEKDNNLKLTDQFKLEKKQTEHERNAKEALEKTLEITNKELSDIRSLCEALRIENVDYQAAFEKMRKEHQQKMADLALREEEAKKQVASWEQMYREWMATMERRVNNLQLTNEELQTWLHNDNENDLPHHQTDNKNQRR